MLQSTQNRRSMSGRQSHPSNRMDSITTPTMFSSGTATPTAPFEYSIPTPSGSLDICGLGEQNEDLLTFLGLDNSSVMKHSVLENDMFIFSNQATQQGSPEIQHTPNAGAGVSLTALDYIPAQNNDYPWMTVQAKSADLDESTIGSQIGERRLSELSGYLATQIDHHSRREKSTAGSTSIDVLARLFGDVLTSTMAFKEILDSYTKARPPTEQASGRTSWPDANTSDGALETATILQILTVYIRLTQFHQSLYAYILLMLRPLDQHQDFPEAPAATQTHSVPVLFPNLSFGGVPLSRYPHFQIKFVLQICVDHLGMMEAAIGLPDDFRVGMSERNTRFTDSTMGILGQCSGRVALLVRTVMMESEQPVQAIRKTLIELREELQGSIQV